MTAVEPTGPRAGHPLLITDDDALAGDVLRLAAAAGVPIDVERRADAQLGSWATAPVVLVGADRAASVARHRPPWRGEVHLLARGDAEDGLFRVAMDVGARSVLELPAADRGVVELLADAGDGARPPAVTVGIVGGSGGVGASVLAAALGVVAARSGPSVLVDLDPLGPGAARLVGIDGPSGTTWEDLQGSHGRLGGRALRESLARSGGLGVLGWSTSPTDGDVAAPDPVSPSLAREVVTAAQRGHDWVVLDLPRSSDGLVPELLARCDHLVLVVRAALGGVAAGARMADRLQVGAAEAGVVVRSRRGSPPEEDVARAVGLPLLGVLPDERRLEEHLDLGLGPVRHRRSALAVTASRLVDRWGGGR